MKWKKVDRTIMKLWQGHEAWIPYYNKRKVEKAKRIRHEWTLFDFIQISSELQNGWRGRSG